jgi:hypothetical protein
MTLEQQHIVETIKDELAKQNKYYASSNYFNAVWFRPSSANFLFADKYVEQEIIKPLIDNNILVYKGIEVHQGEKMIKYSLKKTV